MSEFREVNIDFDNDDNNEERKDHYLYYNNGFIKLFLEKIRMKSTIRIAWRVSQMRMYP